MLLKKELKDNLKSFVIWTSIIAGFAIMMIAVYPAFSKDLSAINELIESFPDGMLKAFNMDVISFDTAIGYFATEGYMFITILGGCFSAIIAGSIISKEESDKTAEFLLSRPITRTKIITTKMLTTFIYIVALNLIVSLITFIGFGLIGGLDFTKWLLLSIGPLLLGLTFASASFLISCFVTKSRKVMSMSLGLVFGTWMLSILASLSDKISFLKYISPFEYVNSKYLIIDEKIPLIYIALIFIIISTCITLTYIIYNKKDIEA